MKNLQKGSTQLIILVLVVVLVVITGAVYYERNKSVAPQVNPIDNSMDNATSTRDSVSKISKPEVTATGTLRGTALIIQNTSQSCPNKVSNENFGIKIYRDEDVVKKVKFNVDGSFSVNLEKGSYSIYPDNYPDHIVEANMVLITPHIWGSSLPQKITITPSITVTLNLKASYVCNAI